MQNILFHLIKLDKIIFSHFFFIFFHNPEGKTATYFFKKKASQLMRHLNMLYYQCPHKDKTNPKKRQIHLLYRICDNLVNQCQW